MVYVRKLDGREERYNPDKLRRSLENSGAEEETIKKIISKVDRILYDGIDTKVLFRFVFKEFKRLQPHVADRYDLKNSILRLGREGFFFEAFVSKIFQKKGYEVKLNEIMNGQNITHEVDISAEKDKESLMIECKHHEKPWLGTDIQTALYVYARFLDIKKYFTSPMLVTNTKFSKQVVEYSKGVDLRLMGWKYPFGDSLEYNIEKFRLYPVTMLCSLDKNKVDMLLKNKILLVDMLKDKSAGEISKVLRVPRAKAEKIIEESKTLCGKGSNLL